MGKHLLHVLLCLSLMVSFLQALRCIHCPKLNSEGKCLTKETTCRLKRGEKCVLRILYINDTMEFGIQECSKVCPAGLALTPTSTLETRCCRDKPLCNKF